MRLAKIFDYLPPPKFLDIPFAGLSISDSYIRCIKFSKKEGGLFIEKYSERKIAHDVVTSGEINDKEEFIKVLKVIKEDLNLKYVKISIPEEKAYLFNTKIPVVREE